MADYQRQQVTSADRRRLLVRESLRLHLHMYVSSRRRLLVRRLVHAVDWQYSRVGQEQQLVRQF